MPRVLTYRLTLLALFFGGVCFYLCDAVAVDFDLEKLLERQKTLAIHTADYQLNSLRIARIYAESDPDTTLLVAKRFLKSSDHSSLVGQVWYTMAVGYSYLAHYDSSAIYAFKAIDFAKTHQDSSLLLKALNNIGIDKYYEQDYLSALTYFEEVIAISSSRQDTMMMAHGYCNKAMVLGDMGDNDQEMQLYDLVMSYYQDLGYQEGIANMMLNRGTVYTKQGKYELARTEYQSALEIYQQLDYPLAIGHTYQNLSENAIGQANFDLALQYARLAMDYALLAKSNQDRLYAYELFKNIYQARGDHRMAFSFLEQYYSLKDSLYDLQKQKQIGRLHTIYETDKKEQHILLLAAENKVVSQELKAKHEFQVMLIITLVIVLVGSVVSIYMMRQRNQLKQSLMREEISVLKLQIKSIVNKPSIQGTDLERINESLVNPLSARELEVVERIFTNKTNQEIADELFVSINTIKTHLKNIYAKLGVSNRRDVLDTILMS